MRKYRALIIDDMLFMRELISRSIRTAFPDIEPETAINGEEAKRKIDLVAYDIILCDWELPDIKGNELLRWLREHPIYKDVPFVMVTAKNERDYILEAKELGADEYIIKPLTIDVLSRKILAALSKRRKNKTTELPPEAGPKT